MENKVIVDEAKFKELDGKVVVLTGGANGIGAATVRYLSQAGAKVVFGDYNKDAGENMLGSLSETSTQPVFVQMDASEYGDNIKLFRTALEKYGRIDHAIACAGIIERGKWFDPGLTIETVEQPETTQTIDINFLGVAYFTRIAVVYLKHGRKENEDKSIVLISSAAGFRESPGLFMYQCTKHAVMGLLRATRKIIYERDNIRINAICPAISDTQMTATIIDSFKESKQVINTPDDVAKYIVGLEVAPHMNGKAVYVEGGRGWEIMDGLDRTMPAWLGDEPTKRIREHLEHIKSVSIRNSE
ncbi:hypothetical protein LTR37_000837 [Vermiconidia calcicola]|uniref:Uncharacterized protein n=1 Tax=Vermiconidia calcicola TaxID=1690605 RepID=A0ACC3NXF4_9PEZI|nr:hypothetical protein LTR37_000837 [Vermiconidia calcicola]